MSSVATHLSPASSPEPIFPLSVEQYHQMIDAGVLTEDDPVELIEGILVYKMRKKPKHRIALAKLRRALEPLLPGNMSLQLQEPITLADGEPEPGAVVFRGVPEDYTETHPQPDDIALVIEVADATLRRDRGMKLRSFACAGIAIYWIVDLAGRRVEVYSNPDPDASKPTYAKPRIYNEKSKVPLEISGRKIGAIAVADVLP